MSCTEIVNKRQYLTALTNANSASHKNDVECNGSPNNQMGEKAHCSEKSKSEHTIFAPFSYL